MLFDNVSFAFDQHVVLDRISFSIPEGSMKILLGASGAAFGILTGAAPVLMDHQGYACTSGYASSDHWRKIVTLKIHSCRNQPLSS